MPLDLDTLLGPDTGHLREALIGNKDLKYKLICDGAFVQALIEDFTSTVNEVVAKSPSKLLGLALLGLLDSKIVVVEMIAGFSGCLDPSRAAGISHSIDSLARLVAPIMALCRYYVESYLSAVCGKTDFDKKEHLRFEGAISYAIDVLIGLANSRNIVFNGDPETGLNVLWKFTTAIAVVENTVLASLQMRLFRLVPLLLDASRPDNASLRTYTVTLLLALLNRLALECDTIVDAHFPLNRNGLRGVIAGQNSPHLTQNAASYSAFADLVFCDPHLPNIEPNAEVFRAINVPHLVDLIASAAQVFAFVKENDYDIVMVELESERGQEHGSTVFVLSPKLYLALLLMLKHDHAGLKLVSLNLISLYLANLSAGTASPETVVFRNYKRLLPRIIEQLQRNAHAPIPAHLFSPARILADLCTRYPVFCDEIRRCNLDYQLLDTLEAQFGSSGFFSGFRGLKHTTGPSGKKLVNFTALSGKTDEPSEAEIIAVSDALLLLSVFTSNSEEYRHRVVEHKKDLSSKNVLSRVISELVDSYRFLLAQMQLVYRVLYGQGGINNAADLRILGKNVGTIISFLRSPIFTSVFYLVRSLSRSVATLRTFFVDCNSLNGDDSEGSADPASPTNTNNLNIRYTRENKANASFIANMLQIMKRKENTGKIMRFFCDDNEGLLEAVLKAYNLNKSVILGSIANFVLDFSSFRYDIVNDGFFLRSLAEIYHNSTTGGEILGDSTYQKNVIQLDVLQIVKSYMYNENQENKKELLEFLPLSMLFDKILYGIVNKKTSGEDEEISSLKLRQKLVSFDVLRNLTAGSLHFSETISESYLLYVEKKHDHSVPQTWTDFFVENVFNFELFVDEMPVGSKKEVFFNNDDFLLRLISNENYVSLVTAINFVEDHRYTNIVNFKKTSFPQEAVVNIWKRLLSLTISKSFEKRYIKGDNNLRVKFANNLNEIKLLIIWIIINLTWKNDDYGLQFPENKFKMYDTIEGRRRGTSERLFSGQGANSSYRIDIDDSDEEENEPEEENEGAFLTALERAKILYNHGFGLILDCLYTELTTAIYQTADNSTKGGVGSSKNGLFSIQRFDELNSNDLLEKVKTANYQIASLVVGQHTPSRPVISGGPLAERELQPDVNRGGEGFGYGSDEEYADARSGGEHDHDNMDENDNDTNDDEELVDATDEVVYEDSYWVN